jgi:hypothetical protein
MSFRRASRPLVRILVSEQDEWLRGIIADLFHRIARVNVSLAIVIPPGIRDVELLETAAKQKFDAAVLLVNNISYESYDSSARGECPAEDGVLFVKKLVTLFRFPVIALYGSPDDELYASRLVNAGATTALKLACPMDDIEHALKRCLNIW